MLVYFNSYERHILLGKLLKAHQNTTFTT